MKYAPPLGEAENASYTDGNPEHGILGSVVPAKAVEPPQREIEAVIRKAGLTPSDNDLTQLWQAIVKIIGVEVPLAKVGTPGIMSPDGSTCTVDATGLLTTLPSGAWRPETTYKTACTVVHADNLYIWRTPSGPEQTGVGAKEPGVAGSEAYWLDYADYLQRRMLDLRIGQYEWWEDDLERPGWEQCLGGVITNFSRKYPKAAAYFETPHGKKRLVTQAEYDALHVATWHTNADGTKVGWQGIGGVNKFVWDKTADTLRLPDLAGMSPEQIGDSLDVGGVQGDAERRLQGWLPGYLTSTSGSPQAASNSVLYWGSTGSRVYEMGTTFDGRDQLSIDSQRTVPTAAKNQPRAWGALACVYLGAPVTL